MRKKTKNKVVSVAPKKVNKTGVQDAIIMYENYLLVERGYSDYTASNYLKDIHDFNEFVKGQNFGDLLNLSTNNISRYYISYLSNNFSKRSINRKLSSLRGFYRYMKEIKVCDDNPFDEVQSVKTEKTLPHFLQKDEVNAMKIEYNYRKENNFDVEYINENNNKFSFDLKAGVLSKNGGREIDPYKFTHQLLDVSQNNGLKVYENTEVIDLNYLLMINL